MRKERAMHLHDAMVYVGWIAGPEAHALAYWTMRLADELDGIRCYEFPYRALRKLAWENTGLFSSSQYAVRASYPQEVRVFLMRFGARFTPKYASTLKAIGEALNGMDTVPTETGRKPLALAA
ncbi:hypothetical protein [Sphingomonas sp. 3-13AW]|uniref:hypothetical protein n=1 Tax=Sphingomonas sp. 3-13AW TaxID=3050450 RepID=UPI003BB4D5E8